MSAFPTIQAGGVKTSMPKRVYYTGTDTLQPGMLLCYDWNHAGYTSGTTAENLAENLRRRTYYVEKPSLDNAHMVAGYVVGGKPNMTGPCEIDVVPLEGTLDQTADLYTNLSIAIGDVVGVSPGSYYASKWTIGRPLGIWMDTQDRSTTAGTVRATWGLPANVSNEYIASKCFRFSDDFAGPNQVSSAANGALAGFNTYLATGTASTYPMGVGATFGPGGQIKLTTDATGSRPASIQLNGEPVILAANKPCFFRCRVNKDNVAATSQLFIGLSITDASLNASDPSDYVAFKAATAALTLESRKASGTKATLATGNNWVASTFKDLAFYWDGNATIRAWEDEVAMTVTLADSARPVLPLTLSAEVYDTGATANIAAIDRWEVANAR